MNISGVVIKCLAENESDLVDHVKLSELCEYHLSENGKIVVTIVGKDIMDDMRIMKEIKKFPNVLSAEIAYSYCEEELNIERENLLSSDKLPDWLNDNNIKAEDIPYNGDIKSKLR